MNHIVKPFKPYFNTPLDPRKTQGLIAYYDARLQGGGTELCDLTQRLYRGSLLGVTWDDNCLLYDNPADVVNIGRFDIAPPMTLLVRLLWDGNTTRNNCIMAKRDSWNDADMRWLFLRRTTGRIAFQTKTTYQEFSSYTLTSNIFIDIGLTINSTSMILYADGVRVGTGTMPTLSTDTTAMVRIGNCQDAEAWSGKIESVKIFNRVLLPSEIKSHYQDPYYFFERPKIYGFISSSSGSSLPAIINNYRQQGVM